MPQLTLILEQCLAPIPGGTGRYSREVATAVGQAAPPGWHIDGRVAWHRNVRAAQVQGVRGPRRLAVDPRVLARVWDRGLPPLLPGDVVHALTPLAPPRGARGGKLVVTVHDAVPWSNPETLSARGVRWHRSMIERASRSADVIVVPTAAVADELAGLAGISDRVVVIGEGVAKTLSAPASASRIAEARSDFGLPERYVVTVGTLEPRKGLDVLLDAMTLPETGGTVLVLVGQQGWGGLDLQSEAHQLGLDNRVLSLGRLADRDLAAVVSGAAVSVSPSRSEGFGLPVAEAMAMGVPVVHSSAPALVEVAGGAGIEVPIGDAQALSSAIGRLMDDADLAAERSTAGLERADHHSWSRVANELWRLYDRLQRS